jgi:hypothetical protein
MLFADAMDMEDKTWIELMEFCWALTLEAEFEEAV